jgi:predicted transcriptional regulator of viral defense system|tara:strand:+ start:4609 stop:5505 length:897 start_codon:yes stop_codon:yes gene_type:complete
MGRDTVNFTDGIEQTINNNDLPVITFYDFFVLGYYLLQKKTLNGEPLKRLPHDWDQTRAKNALRRLENRKAIVIDSDFRSGVWRVTQSTRAGSAEEVACIADPFAYVSHLSAMQRYGLTDRSPQALHLTTPKKPLWNTLRNKRLHEDLPDINQIEAPLLNRPGFKDTLRRRPIVVHISSHPWTPAPVSGEETRITSIGQTFADMLIEPKLCGGMRHVLDVWENEADQWVPEIIAAIDPLDSKIVKIRAGYILSEVMDIDDPALYSWELFAQRGGSRKLDPDAKYASKFSERWMISINV